MHITHIYIFNDPSKIGVMHRGLPWAGYVNKVSDERLQGSLLYENLLLVLLNNLLVVLFIRRHELYQLVIYMHEMMMQHLVIRQQQLLK